MPFATFRHTAAAQAPAPEVWEALQDAATWGAIGPIDEVFDATHEEDGALTGFGFRTSAAGTTWEGTARRVAVVPGERVEFALSTREIKAKLAIELTDAGDQTDLAVRLEAEPAGMLATIFWGVVREAITSDFTRRVDEFAAGFAA
jgi:hypothetical protein